MNQIAGNQSGTHQSGRKRLTRNLTAAAATAALGIGAIAAGAASPAAADTAAGDGGTRTVAMENFDVTVGESTYVPTDDPNLLYDGMWRTEVTVCAKQVPEGETVRVSTDPWQIHNEEGGHHGAQQFEGSLPEGAYPYGNAEAPATGTHERQLANGECASGPVYFPGLPWATVISYESSLGDVASWQLDF